MERAVFSTASSSERGWEKMLRKYRRKTLEKQKKYSDSNDLKSIAGLGEKLGEKLGENQLKVLKLMLKDP